MALTKEFKITIRERAQRDPEFRQAMLIEAVNELLADNIEIAKSLLRDYINATISFEPLAQRISKNSKSLQRMFGPSGNPTTDSLFAVIHTLQDVEGIKLTVRVTH
jgi:DNA-binding phage protein